MVDDPSSEWQGCGGFVRDRMEDSEGMSWTQIKFELSKPVGLVAGDGDIRGETFTPVVWVPSAFVRYLEEGEGGSLRGEVSSH